MIFYSIRHKIKDIRFIGILWGVIVSLTGVLFLSLSDEVARTLVFLAGITSLLSGAFVIFETSLNYKQGSFKFIRLILGAFISAIGIFMIFNSDVTMIMIGYFLGILAMAAAVERFLIAYQRKLNSQKYGAMIIYGLINIIFSILILFTARLALPLIVMIIGVYLLVSGALVIAGTSYFPRRQQER